VISLDERAVEAAARRKFPVGASSPWLESRIRDELRRDLAAYFAALDREALVERVARALVGDCDGLSKMDPRSSAPATDGQVALARHDAEAVLAALGLFTPDTKESTR
jgi:hypothetical protein